MSESKESAPPMDPYIEEYLGKLGNDRIAFVISRNKNKNIVVYEAKLSGDALDASEPITVYWLDIDPEYQKKARAKGKDHDREELNWIEKKMAYGCVAGGCGGCA